MSHAEPTAGATATPPTTARRASAHATSGAALAVAILVLDVDGVLTDGSIMLDDHGRELKRFCAPDGVGIRAWQRLGLRLGVITGRGGTAVRHRLADLGVSDVVQSSRDKAQALDEMLERCGLAPSGAAYLGDDWPDLPALRRVGYPMAVANAADAVKAAARFVTTRAGGSGAVREAIEHLLANMRDASGATLLSRALALYDRP